MKLSTAAVRSQSKIDYGIKNTHSNTSVESQQTVSAVPAAPNQICVLSQSQSSWAKGKLKIVRRTKRKLSSCQVNK